MGAIFCRMKRLETLGYLGPNRRAEVTVSEWVLQPTDEELNSRDAVLSPRDLEIHVAMMILATLDVGQQHPFVTLLDHPD